MGLRRRQRGRGACRLRPFGSDRHLPHHPGVARWASTPTTGPRPAGRTSGAKCPTSSRCNPRPAPRAPSTAPLQKGALATTFTASQGLLVDGAQHVQDRRRADPGGHPRRRPHDRHPCPVDLRRPLRRDACPDDRLGHAGGQLGPGGPRLRPGRPRRHPAGTRAVPPLLRRVPDLARAGEDRPALGRGHGRADRRGRPHRLPPPGDEPGHPRRAGHGSEPGRVLPGPRGVQPYYLAVPGIVQATMDSLAQTDRALVRPGRVPRRSRRRAGHRAHGLGSRRGTRGGRRPRQATASGWGC